MIDERVEMEMSPNLTAIIDFTPAGGVEEIDFEVHSTIQKVGEFRNENGEQSILYVTAVVATDPKMDNGYNEKHGVEAYIYLYWIDNLGINNELYSVSVSWNTHGKAVSDRKAKYGVMNFTTLFFEASTDVSISGASYYKVVHGEYTGFVLGCTSSIYVTNLGTVTCIASSGILT